MKLVPLADRVVLKQLEAEEKVEKTFTQKLSEDERKLLVELLRKLMGLEE